MHSQNGKKNHEDMPHEQPGKIQVSRFMRLIQEISHSIGLSSTMGLIGTFIMLTMHRNVAMPSILCVDKFAKTCIIKPYAVNGRVLARIRHQRAAGAEKRREEGREHGPGVFLPDR